MAVSFLAPVDLNKNELQNARLQQLAAAPGSPVEGLVYWDTVGHYLWAYNGSAWKQVPHVGATVPSTDVPGQAANAGTSGDAARADHVHANAATSAPTVSTLMARDAAGRAQVVDPSAAQDIATKNYVDSLSTGVSWKNAVRAATTVAGTLASSFANGSVIDGITLATGDRILIKNQAAPAENGIVIVAASGAPTRAADMDAWTEVPAAATVVQVGTANADTAWVCTSDAGGTLNTTAITWVQFGTAAIGANMVTNAMLAQAATLTLKGNSTGGTANVADLTVAQVKTMLGFTSKYTTTIGNAASTSIVVTHSLGTTDVQVQVWELTGSLRQVFPEIQDTSTTTCTLVFAVAPALNSLRVVVIG